MIDFKKEIEKFDFINQISETAILRDEEVYIIGGFVRDIILGRKRSEMDFLIVGNGIEFAKELALLLGISEVAIYKNFGTAHFKYQNISLEFVGARKESYRKNSRNPKVQPGNLEDDLDRRDFTINTLAVSLNKRNFGVLIDKYNGLKDIEDRIIKTPLDPQKTFEDDPLRIMRAFRFASQLGFNIDKKVLEAIKKKNGKIKNYLSRKNYR